MEVLIEEIVIYGSIAILSVIIIWRYLRSKRESSQVVHNKIMQAKREGRYEPISLHPHIDLNTCIGSGACVAACPEQDILGLVNGKASVINATNCVGHGACFHACPVEAITLRIGTEKRGVDLPHLAETYETNMRGIYIAGELGGMGLIKNSVEQGEIAVQNIAKAKKNNKEKVLDLVIIGAGPTGISGALTAKEKGLNFEILDQDTLGGTVYSFPRSKVVMTHPMYLPTYGKVKLYDTSKDELLKLWNDALSKKDISVIENTKVTKIQLQEDKSYKVVSEDGREWHTQHILLAIGRRGTPRKLGIPGEELPKVYYRLLEPEELYDKNIIVVGGGDSAVESAMLLMDQNHVTLSYRKNAFARIKAKNQEKIDAAINLGKIKILWESELQSIHKDHVKIKLANKEELLEVDNDLVYVFIGGVLPTQFLKDAGILIEKRFGYIMKKHK